MHILQFTFVMKNTLQLFSFFNVLEISFLRYMKILFFSYKIFIN